MTTRVRRGLPRVRGGEPWPVVDAVAPGDDAVAEAVPDAAEPAPVVETSDAAPVAVSEAAAATTAPAVAGTIRRGLPRIRGGEPWPVTGGVAPAPAAAEAPEAGTAPWVTESAAPAPTPATSAETPVESPIPSSVPVEGGASVRRGLPRVRGGEPWPPAGSAPVVASAPEPVPAPVVPIVEPEPEPEPEQAVEPVAASVVAPEPITEAPAARPATSAPTAPVTPPVAANPEPRRIGRYTVRQWVGIGVLGIAGLAIVAGVVILAARGLTTIPSVSAFLKRYPGEYALPSWAPVGFPAWVGWQHFFTIFLMVLIIRSGLQVRREQRPGAYWASKRSGRKVSLTVWLHQSLDLLWFVNGVIFVILLFSTGQWVRIVPTSWEVFPNALTALQKYLSLDWPTEDGWVNYNALQQLAYFVTVFVAAPLAAITGVRMSTLWPNNRKLNSLYRAPLARKLHFPVMIYFVAFIVVHVTLVLATGALRNLNHMFGGSDEINWIGFGVFVGAMVVVAAGWVAARPLVVAPIAKLFGTVSSR